MDNYKGYSLFNDIKDKALQLRNRAVVMSNIYEDHPDDRNGQYVSKKGALLIFGYMDAVPSSDREELVEEFHEQMRMRGYVSVS